MQLALFSVSYAGLWGQAALDLRAFARRAADLGYDAVMLAGKRPHLAPLDADDASLAALRDALDSAGMRCAVVAAYTDLAPPHAAITTNADYVRLPRYRYRPDAVNYEPAGPDLVRAVPFGTGFIDYPAFFRGLTDGGFDGVATYEMCSPVRGGGSIENLDRYAATYVRWM